VSVSNVPRHLVVAAFESLAVGDYDEAAAILITALEEDAPMPPRCPICAQQAWPGDAARHVLSLHRAATEELDVAA
jgi:hypothetical protein